MLRYLDTSQRITLRYLLSKIRKKIEKLEIELIQDQTVRERDPEYQCLPATGS